jgi:hypothetical protein
MTHQIYSRQQLKDKKLDELKAIASQLSIIPKGDKRKLNSWLEAILQVQPQRVSVLKPLVEMSGDDCVVAGEIVATITSDDDLTQPWVVKINCVEVHRRATWALAYDYVRTHAKYGTLPNPQPVTLPAVGESYFISNFFLRCTQAGGEYAAVWDVFYNSLIMDF